MAFSPVVLYPLTLPALLSYVLATQTSRLPTTLVVCSSREVFVQDLLRSVPLQQEQGEEGLHRWITPTLHNLFTGRHVKLAFCPSVPALLAHLTAYSKVTTEEGIETEGKTSERIILVNPLSLHAPTPSFSAQGLSRSFATAVETALRIHAQLLVVECRGELREAIPHCEEIGTTIDEEGESHIEADEPWEQEVSILNVSARKFGSGNSERAWAGRTVKVKRIAARWFRFHRLHDPGEHET